MTDKTGIISDLHNLGINIGDRIIVHSSYKALGGVDGGPQALVDAFTEAVGPEGTVLMPTFQEKIPELYDAETTPSMNGIITEFFRKLPGSFRSIHPTHPVAVWGRDAEELASKHDTATALGKGSPIHSLIEKEAYIILLGVGHNRNSSIHVAEALFGVPYLDVPYSPEYAKPMKVLRNGVVEQFIIKECPGCSENFAVVGDRLESKGLEISGRVGDAETRVVKGSDLIDTVHEILSEDISALLCDNPECTFCPEARKLI